MSIESAVQNYLVASSPELKSGDTSTLDHDLGMRFEPVTDSMLISIAPDDADEALVEFGDDETTQEVPASYLNLIKVCKFNSIDLAA